MPTGALHLRPVRQDLRQLIMAGFVPAEFVLGILIASRRVDRQNVQTLTAGRPDMLRRCRSLVRSECFPQRRQGLVPCLREIRDLDRLPSRRQTCPTRQILVEGERDHLVAPAQAAEALPLRFHPGQLGIERGQPFRLRSLRGHVPEVGRPAAHFPSGSSNPLPTSLGRDVWRSDRRPGNADLKARMHHQLPPPGCIFFPPPIGERAAGRPVLDPGRCRWQFCQSVSTLFKPRHHGRKPLRSVHAAVDSTGGVLGFEMLHGLFNRRQFCAGVFCGDVDALKDFLVADKAEEEPTRQVFEILR